jgi:lambda repressor-like predicted transcriptional regulator
MDALDINYRLRRLGTSQAQIARELGVTQSVVGNVVNNRITAHDIASHIAKLLGMQVEELWPERYRFKPRGPAQNRRGKPSPANDLEENEMS